MQNKNFLSDIVFLRAISIVFVVAFHAYGMMYAAAHFPALKDTYYQMYFTLNQCVFINIAMPMFVFVSGYLFAFLRQRGKYPNFVDLVKNKAKRVLLPYFVFGLIMMATTNNFHPLVLLYGSYWHLWFLPMLFWCFIVAYLIDKYAIKSYLQIIILFVSFVLSLFPSFIPRILGTHNITICFCWFYLGMVVYCHKDVIISNIAKYKLVYILIFIYLFITIYKPTEYADVYWYNIIAQVCMIISLWYLCNRVNWEKQTWAQPIISFGNYSYGIYIFHNWIQMYLISSTAQRLFPLERWAGEHTILFPFGFFLLSLIISYLLTWLLLKTKVGRFLIG